MIFNLKKLNRFSKLFSLVYFCGYEYYLYCTSHPEGVAIFHIATQNKQTNKNNQKLTKARARCSVNLPISCFKTVKNRLTKYSETVIWKSCMQELIPCLCQLRKVKMIEPSSISDSVYTRGDMTWHGKFATTDSSLYFC